MRPTTIMGNSNGPPCAGCGRKIKQQDRLVTLDGKKYHALCDPERPTL